MDARLLGAMEAYHGPEVVLFDRARSIADVHYFDVLSEFLLGAANIGVWRWLTAQELVVVDLDPAEVRERIAALGPDALRDPGLRREFGPLFLRIVPEEDELPHRVPQPDGSYRTKVASLTCPEPSLWHAFDAIRSRFAVGRAPERVTDAWSVVPVGRMGGLRSITLPWGTFEPNEPGADFFRWLVERRVLLQSGEIDPGPGWTPDSAAAALKACGVALVGSFAQVISEQSAERRRVVLIGGGGTTEVRWSPRSRRDGPWRIESPGHWYFPVAASAILAEGRLTGYAAREAVRDEGGRPLYAATDSVIAEGLTPESALAVQRAFERLNPTDLHGPHIEAASDGLRLYPDRRTGPLVLRITDENFGEPRTDERGRTYRPRVPLTFTGWHSMRYLLTDSDGRPVHWSEHGLGELIEVLA